MAIIKDVTVKINNGTATLDAPVQFYEKDHDVELRFRLMDYKYKYDKDPQNILNSVDEDVLEAYTTIVNPRGYELEQINGVVKNDVVIFRLDPTYTDELDELGTYKLQIHIKCTHSEFTIPPITFEVLQRLKGIKVVTDGEDEVDNSEILDNSSKFVSDETGKLIIEWKKGDMISSAKLNAMVDVINDAVDEEKIRQANEKERERKANNKIQELENTRVEYINKIDNELDSFDDQFDASMSDYETRFNALTVSQQQDAEVIDARDGEQTLRARLDRDIQKPSIIYEEVEGSYITVDTTCGYAQNVEIVGNTIQDQNDLADIRSVGDKVEGQELYEIPVLSANKNLFSRDFYNYALYSQLDNTYLLKEINLPVGTIVISIKKIKEQTSDMGNFVMQFWDNTTYNTSTRKSMINKGWGVSSKNIVAIEEGRKYYIAISISDNALSKEVILEKVKDMYEIQIEVGNTATPYEPCQEQQITILSPVQLEKVGDVADRIVCKDGVWGVEKNVSELILNGSEDYEVSFTPGQGTTKAFLLNSKVFSNIWNKLKNVLCSSIKSDSSSWGNDSPNMVLAENGKLYFKVLTSELETQDVNGFKKWIHLRNVFIKVPTNNQEFIPLPHDQQIKLRAFANKTNIHFECEIEPTLKASVPKSIGATVNTHTEQIDNLSKELDRVKKLEESVASEVVTESNFTTVEQTSNGYFEDVKLEGKTLVNHMRNWKAKSGTLPTIINGSFTNDFVTNMVVMYCEIKTGISTFICDVETADGRGLVISIFSNFGDIGATNDYLMRFTANNNCIQKLDIPSDAKYLVIQRADANTGIATVKNLMLLEGDHSQNPPEYFEGIKSVGQDVEEISVLSTNNRCYDNTFVLGMLSSSTGDFATSTSSHDWCSLKNYINVKSSGKYFVSLENADNIATRIGVFFYNNNSYLYMIDINNNDYITIPSNANAIKIRYLKLEGSSKNIYNFNILISENDTKLKQDKKRILYYNDETQTWEKPILRQWDSIEKHSDGKYYYHKRSGEVVLNGSESGWKLISNSNNTTRFNIPIIDCTVNNKAGVICDKFNYVVYVDSECVWLGNNSPSSLNLAINNSKLSTQDVAGFKAWLQANPTTVVYQLAQEQVYECTDLDLITYADETNLMVKGGAIVPKTTLKVHQNIANIATILQEKVNVLENNVGHVTEVFVDSKIEPINSEIGNINNEIGNINNEIGNINNDLTRLTESIEGSSVSVDSKEGYLKDIEILGNTIQNQNDLADIRSVGDKVEGQELYEIPVLSRGKNLFDGELEYSSIDGSTGENSGNNTTLIRSRNYIEIPKSKTIRFSKNGTACAVNTFIYDSSKKIVRTTGNTFTLSGEEKYIRFYLGGSIDDKIQIEEGTQTTPYEPYQEQRITILSPTPLEKVGDVADRIICKDGVWGVEKNIYTVTSDVFYVHSNKKMWYVYTDRCPGWIAKDVWDKVENRIICNYYKEVAVYTDVKDGVGIFIDHKDSSKNIIIGTGDANITSLPHDLEVKYQLVEPQFIPLPHDQQIKLRTFANKTNISFGCEIEPTLKASVPKSIGATVNTHTEQIDNLSKELKKINNLEESISSTVTSESNFTTVENTNNGYFDDVKLEGKTLVNLFSYRKIENTKIEGIAYSSSKKVNGGFTVIFTAKTEHTDRRIQIGLTDIECNGKAIELNVRIKTIEVASEYKTYIIHCNNTNEGYPAIRIVAQSAYLEDIIILEGDHTQNPPEYFEGIKSVGQDVDGVEILSQNQNLLDETSVTPYTSDTVNHPVDSIKKEDGWYVCDAGEYGGVRIGKAFLKKGAQYYLNFEYENISNGGLWGTPITGTNGFTHLGGNSAMNLPKGLGSKSIKLGIPDKDCYIDCMLLRVGVSGIIKYRNVSITTGLLKQDKKRILYYNNETQTWEKPVLREWDSIEKHSDGKYYYHKRSGEVVLNGSENWHRGGSSDSKTITSYFGYDIPNNVDKNYVCCDNFPRIDLDASLGDYELEGARNSSGNIYININKARLSEDNLVGFKAWLQANPTTVVYQLAEEKVYECTNLDLITYENETNLVVKSGVLNPKVSLKVSKGVGNVVSTLQNKVTMLEQMIYNLMKMLNIQQSNIDE